MTFRDRLDRYFFRKENNSQWIVFFRIAVGLLILLHFISILPDFDLLFSTNGIIPSDIMGVFIPDYILTLPKIVSFFKDLGYSQETVLFVYKFLYITIGLLLVFGVFPRISAFILLFLQIALVKGFSFYAYGADYFTSMSLFYLVLIPSGDQHSLISKIKKYHKSINRTPYLRLFQIHLSISYFFGGLGKIIGFNWRNGEAIWKTLNLPYVNSDFNFDFLFLADFPFILVILGWIVISIELGYFLFIWFKKTRRC